MKHHSIVPLLSIAALVLALSADAAVTVTSTADAGGTCPGADCTLRQAIAVASAGDTIIFSLPPNSTITLTTEQLRLTKNVTINGPGANLLTIRRSAAAGTPLFRIFEVYYGNNVVTLSGLTISNGDSPGYGGGVYNGGTLSIFSCAITGNRTFTGNAQGGGITNNGTLTVTNSTISGNSAAGGGGGIRNFYTLTVTNSTISGNSAAAGGGIHNHNTGTVTITNSTITGNSVNIGPAYGSGGGILNFAGNFGETGGTVNVKNTIIAKNTSTNGNSPDFWGKLASQGYNLIGNPNNTTIEGTTTGNQTNVDPLLDSLRDNGGRTLTHALLTGSPAIDKGNSSGLAYDQRHSERAVSDPDIPNLADGSDIGAYETQWDQLSGCSAINRVVSNKLDIGAGSLRTVINNVCKGTPITFGPGVTGDINLTSGQLLINKSLTITGPGANLVTVRRSVSANFRIFEIFTGALNVTISGLKISNGGPDVNGGGIYMGSGSGGILRVVDCIVSGNSGGTGAGGGIHNSAGILVVINSTISGNTTNSTNPGGGGIYNNASAILSNSTVSGNAASSQYGGGIYNTATGDLQIYDSVISGNTSSSNGAGIYNNTGEVTITNSLISGNGASGNGGGISSLGTVTIFDSTISGNTSAGGGGILNSSGTLTIRNSTLSDNAAASGNGGGIWNYAGLLIFTNGTIFRNTAAIPSLGVGVAGGILNSDGGTSLIVHSTITANNGEYRSGGIRNTSGSFVSARNTIIARNTSPSNPDFDGTLSSDGYNLIGNTNGATITNIFTGNQLNKDPMLDLLRDNGGPTLTCALLSGSPAIDAGISAGWTSDQRGVSRPVGAATVNGGDGADIGAFEVQAPTPTPTPTPPTTLANISARLRVETGDNALFGGFIITGTQDKKVIIRAIGPSLGLADKLANPTLELYNGATLLASNDDWMDSSPADKQAIIDSTIAPSSHFESAIVRTLPANGTGYTAVVRGANNTAGIGIVEIYDLDVSADSKLANISARGFLLTGDNAMFAGTIVLGPSSQKVIIRAIGPSLSVAGKLLDPILELRDANGGVIRANDNWRVGGQEAEVIASTIPPTNELESAIVAILPANGASYTAIVRGVNDTTGIAVVEVYALQ